MIELKEVMETENEINKEDYIDEAVNDDKQTETPIKEIDLVELLTKGRLGGEDEFLETLMKELEWSENMIYGENLTAANYIYWKTRCETIKEIKNKYCDYLNEKLEK